VDILRERSSESSRVLRVDTRMGGEFLGRVTLSGAAALSSPLGAGRYFPGAWAWFRRKCLRARGAPEGAICLPARARLHHPCLKFHRPMHNYRLTFHRKGANLLLLVGRSAALVHCSRRDRAAPVGKPPPTNFARLPSAEILTQDWILDFVAHGKKYCLTIWNFYFRVSSQTHLPARPRGTGRAWENQARPVSV